MTSLHPARIQSIAILSPRNTPIYVRQFQHSRIASSSAATSSYAAATSETNLKYHYFAHVALDVIEERTGPGRNAEQYLGLLYTLEDLAVYGFQTSTRVKLLIMISLSDQVVRDIDILTASSLDFHSTPWTRAPDPSDRSTDAPLPPCNVQIFRALHTAYLSYIPNPFHSLAPNPLSLLGRSATAASDEERREQAKASLTAMQESTLAIKARQIRSARFDRTVEKIVGVRPPPPLRQASGLGAAGEGVTATAPSPTPVSGVS
ncbi:hypothetical protein ACQY0O_000275 [Thecaphora frezii]